MQPTSTYDFLELLDGPTDMELLDIEYAWPTVAAELVLLDAEIIDLDPAGFPASGGGVDELHPVDSFAGVALAC